MIISIYLGNDLNGAVTIWRQCRFFTSWNNK